jgi:hypothetical protein
VAAVDAILFLEIGGVVNILRFFCFACCFSHFLTKQIDDDLFVKQSNTHFVAVNRVICSQNRQHNGLFNKNTNPNMDSPICVKYELRANTDIFILKKQPVNTSAGSTPQPSCCHKIDHAAPPVQEER